MPTVSTGSGLPLKRGSSDAYDHLAAGILLVNANAQVLFLNRAAQRIIDLHDGLTIGLSGVTAANPSATKELRELITGATIMISQPLAGASRGVIAISRPSGRRPLSLLIVPLAVEMLGGSC